MLDNPNDLAANLSDTEYEPKVRSILTSVGLNESEVAVYISCLGTCSRPASTIAKRAGLKRGQTYNILNSLLQKGIVQEYIKSNTRYFTSINPGSLLSLIERKQTHLQQQKSALAEILPILEKISQPRANQPKVLFFHGMEGVREILEIMSQIGSTQIRAILDPEMAYLNPSSEIAESLNQFIAKRISKNIELLAIVPPSKTADRDYSLNIACKRQVKMFNEKVKLDVAIYCFEDKVAIISNQQHPFGLIISDQLVSHTVAAVHSVLWETLPDYVQAYKVVG